MFSSHRPLSDRLTGMLGGIILSCIFFNGILFLGSAVPRGYAQEEPDTTPPGISHTIPTDGLANVDVGIDEVYIEFTEPMDSTTITTSTFQLNDGSNDIEGEISIDPSQVSAYFKPSANLAFSTTYTVTVSGKVKDLAGNSMGTAYLFSFTTREEDMTPPEVVETFPAGGAIGVSLYETIEAKFSEEIDFSGFDFGLESSSITLLDESGNEVVGEAFSLAPSQVYFDPLSNLEFSATYTATVHAEGVKDLLGNQMESDYSWSFTTQSEKEAKEKQVSGEKSSIAMALWNQENPGDGTTIETQVTVLDGHPIESLHSEKGTTVNLYRTVYDVDGNLVEFDFGRLFTTNEGIFQIDDELATATLSPLQIEFCTPDGYDDDFSCTEVESVETIEAQWTGVGEIGETSGKFKISSPHFKITAVGESLYRESQATGKLNNEDLGQAQLTSLYLFETSKVEFDDYEVSELPNPVFFGPTEQSGSKTLTGGEGITTFTSWTEEHSDGSFTINSFLVAAGRDVARGVFYFDGTGIFLDSTTFDMNGSPINSQTAVLFTEEDDILNVDGNLKSASLGPLNLDVEFWENGEIQRTETWTLEAHWTATEKQQKQSYVYKETTNCEAFEGTSSLLDPVTCTQISSDDGKFKATIKGESSYAPTLLTITINEEPLVEDVVSELIESEDFVIEYRGSYPRDL